MSTARVDYVDHAGAVAAYLNGYPGLTGLGAPLANGVSLALDGPRSPGDGAVATVDEPTGTTADDATSNGRVGLLVHSIGRGAGRGSSNRAARAVAVALAALQGNPATVTTQNGDVVVILAARDIAGPQIVGDVNGRVTYRVDATLVCQGG